MLDFVKPVADVQGGADHRNIDIDKVGIRNIRHPVRVRDHSDGEQHTVACFNMSVNPPRQFKGTHMSRFVDIPNRHEHEPSVKTFKQVPPEMTSRLEADSGHSENYESIHNHSAYAMITSA